MDKIRIIGGHPLRGRVQISGAKNAALPILFSSLLTSENCRYRRIPNLQDIRTTLKLLKQLGAQVKDRLQSNEVELISNSIHSFEAPYDLVRTMRASVVVLGPLLARLGRAQVSLPGGCAIGARPINYHLEGLKSMGAEIQLENGYVVAQADRLRGSRIVLEFPSVGATENLMMAATLAQGETVIENGACEPEIVNLAQALRAMGAEIQGDGSKTILIQGKASLHGCDFEVMGDRIEAGTFLAAAFATRGSVWVEGVHPQNLEIVLHLFEQAGAQLTRGVDSIHLESQGCPQGVDLATLPFPGFPTDMQAQFMAVMTTCMGTSSITENVFENRFMHVPELCRLGADITIRGRTAVVNGKPHLIGAPLMATDLRASASLVIGGLCAQGETQINRIYHLDRGYEQMETKLKSLGAAIERVRIW